MSEFKAFPKIPRLSREMIITEKLDGTNASIWIIPAADVALPDPEFMATVISMGVTDDSVDYYIKAGSRTRFIMPGKSTDNFGFAGWVADNADELSSLGEGVHYGEWWGQGIQRKYGLDEKRFSLFNVGRWADLHNPVFVNERVDAPECCHVVPVLWTGAFDEYIKEAMCSNSESRFEDVLNMLASEGSYAAPGFMEPEGIMIYHTAARAYFKKTFDGDEAGKGR